MLNFGVYYTPAENLCYTAMQKFKEKYGEIPNVLINIDRKRINQVMQNLIGNAIIEQYEKHNLDWKYMHLEEKAIVDGIEFEYLYTDWYYLETINFPTIEYPLINVKNKCSYFLTLEEAWEFVKECEA